MIYDYDHTLDDLADKVAQTVADLRPLGRKYDAIVVRGMSGVLVGVPAALRLRKHLMVVRKPGESTHDNRRIINYSPGKRWIFLDDFTNTGETLKRCQEAMSDEGTWGGGAGVYVGAYLYARTGDEAWRPATD